MPSPGRSQHSRATGLEPVDDLPGPVPAPRRRQRLDLAHGAGTVRLELSGAPVLRIVPDGRRRTGHGEGAAGPGLTSTVLLGTIRREVANKRPPGTQATEVRGALRRLPHRRRVCVVLRYAFGLTEDEVARALGISAGAARTRTSRGARQLSEVLGGAPGVTRLGGWEAAR